MQTSHCPSRCPSILRLWTTLASTLGGFSSGKGPSSIDFSEVLCGGLKGEELVRGSGVPYTVIRPGGLTDGPGGLSQLIVRALLASSCPACLFVPRRLLAG